MEFKNRAAVFLSGFAIFWFSILVAFTVILVRDGPPDGYSRSTTAIILCAFWFGGLALARFVSNKACSFVTIRDDTLVVEWRYPFRRICVSLPINSVGPPRVTDGRDSEGDPYYFSRLTLPDGRTVDLAEGHDRIRCESVCVEFFRASGQSDLGTEPAKRTFHLGN